MHRTGYVVMGLLYAGALAIPVVARLACDGGTARYAEADRGHCLLATCGSGPGVLCRTVF